MLDRPVMIALAAALLALSSAIVIMVVIYLPQRSSLQEAESAVHRLKRDYARFQTMETQALLVDRYTAHVDGLADKLAVQYSGSSVTGELAELFADTNLEVINETYFQPDSKSGMTRVEAAFAFSGRYEDIRRMIDGISRLPFMAIVKEASLEYTDDSAVTAEMNIEFYFTSTNGS